MPFEAVSGLRLYRFESLRHPTVQHAFFTRRGGASPAPWASLNLGATVGDDADRVRSNLSRALGALRLSPNRLAQVWQVHSADILRVDDPSPPGSPIRADGMVTQVPGLNLLMRFADCVPILVFDPVRSVIGIAHAGWLGTVRQIAARLVEKLRSEFRSHPGDLIAGLGPSIGPDHYPIGPEVVDQVRATFGPASDQHLRARDGQVAFDLWSANRAQLEAAGVGSIEVTEICTACALDDWYSHRGEHGRTGRFGAVFGLVAG
jgi:hypothetical protein